MINIGKACMSCTGARSKAYCVLSHRVRRFSSLKIEICRILREGEFYGFIRRISSFTFTTRLTTRLIAWAKLHSRLATAPAVTKSLWEIKNWSSLCIARCPRPELVHGQTVSVGNTFCWPVANHFDIDCNWLVGKSIRRLVSPLQIVYLNECDYKFYFPLSPLFLWANFGFL